MQITVSNLTKTYGKVTAIDNLSFSLRTGCVTGLVGPNGSGKSTLLRLMAGRESADQGDITYDGASIFINPEQLLQRIGLMPDALPDTCRQPVGDYLDFYARANGLKGEMRQEREEQIEEFTQTQGLLARKLTELSKGMKQRVSLARVLMASPEVLLLDEPAAGLDPKARIELRDVIRKLTERKCTILVSSHILTELEDMCDDILILEKGKLRRHGSVTELEDAATANATSALALQFASIDQSLQTKLAALPHYCGMTITGRRSITVQTDDDDAFMAALFAAHLPITGFSRREKTLEDVFLESTSGEVQ